MTDELSELMQARGSAFVFQPQVVREETCWRASYPGADWSVTGATHEEASARLYDDVDGRIQRHEVGWQLCAVRQHIATGGVPGLYEIPRESHDLVMDILTEFGPVAAQAALNDLIAAIEIRRMNGVVSTEDTSQGISTA